MSRNVSKVHSKLSPVNVRPFDMKKMDDAAVKSLSKIGIVLDSAIVKDQIRHLIAQDGYGMDANLPAITTSPSVTTPIQFLQQWLPGFVKVMTAARRIDELIGISTIGNWEDEEIVQGLLEPAGTPSEYMDDANIPLASWNTNFERRTITRFELGINVGILEEGRAAAMRLSSSETKRQQAALGLETQRNAVGFYGWNSDVANRTFGFLNDPELQPAITSPLQDGWSKSGAIEIIGDIRMMIQKLRTQSQDQIDPQKTKIILALPTSVVDSLSVITQFGISVMDWLKQTYPNITVKSAPELMQSVASATKFVNVAYLYAEKIDNSVDGSSDGGEVFMQLVPTKFITLGVEKRAKSYIEDYANATAGTLLKRPWAVVRMIGV